MNIMNDAYKNLIDKLVLKGDIKSQEITNAFYEIHRREFLGEEDKHLAGEDRPLAIGFNQTISQPFTVAFMLNLLEAKRGEKILDVGTGSGWQAALIAKLVSPDGIVVTIERIKELADAAKINIDKFNFVKEGIVLPVHGNAINISPDWPIFDKIISAAEYHMIPDEWKNALAINGRIIAPISGNLIVADKISGNKFEIREYPGFYFVPLIDTN